MQRILLVLLAILCFTFAQTCNTNFQADQRTFSGIIYDVWACGSSSLPGATDLHLPYPACGSQLNSGEPTPPCLIPNSGWACAQDFERAEGAETGLVNAALDTVNRVPTLAPGTHATVINPTQFQSWYKTDPTFNVAIPVNLTASNQGQCNSLIYLYDNQNFYPIDGRGFGNFYGGHNYNFAYAMHLRFTYQGIESFNFAGDDDVFVFINDQLALDLGGVHSTETANLDLTYPTGGCSKISLPSVRPQSCATVSGSNLGGTLGACACFLGLVPGQSYTFDLFYNERHTVASDLKFTTSLLLTCPFYDHCHVCNGDGQSCCTNCTQTCNTHKCDAVTGACIYTPIVCPTPNPPDACVTPTCNPTTGNCSNVPVQCDDGKGLCTTKTCDHTVGCQFTPLICDDGNPCTTKSCDAIKGCVFIPIANCTPCNGVQCPANDACTSYGCSSLTNGVCTPIPTVCDDGNFCTADNCSLAASGCTHTPIVCTPPNSCYNATCDPTKGCVFTPVVCNDNNACTNDTCDSNTGSCVYTPIAVPLGDFCTDSFCDPHTGLKKTAVVCPSACSGCDPNKGCLACPGSGFNLPAAVGGISAGVIAGIVIASVVGAVIFGVGSKKGYDAYMKHKDNMSAAVDNPMYQGNGLGRTNPLYEI